jgi:integrase
MHDFRRTAATRMDSTPGISPSVAMSLLGHNTDIMFRRYIQKHDDRLVEAATRRARRPKESSGMRTVTDAKVL